MGTCFVIQPFDNDEFDQRFDQILAPAIEKSGLEPYRVDRDPRTTIVYEAIERGIEDSVVCLADISLDNPNVWFELGFALASRKETVMICSKERLDRDNRFPFDIQHRSIITYKKGSPQDFEQLAANITAKLGAALKKTQRQRNLRGMSPVKETEGLSPHEVATLVTIMSESVVYRGGVSAHLVCKGMEAAGYNDLATALSLESLGRKEMVDSGWITDQGAEEFVVYALTDRGRDWLLANQDRLKLNVEERRDVDSGDDLPF